MLATILTSLLGVSLFLFLFWKRTKEDYPANQIFTSSLYMLLGIGLGVVLANKFSPIFWFWFSFLGATLGMFVSVLRYKLKIYEIIEASWAAAMPWLALGLLHDSVSSSSLASFLAFFSVVCLYVLFAFLDANYKNFTWYRSGRVGFAGLSTLGIFFLLRALFAPFFPFVISFVNYDAIFSGIMAFIIFLALARLSRMKE